MVAGIILFLLNYFIKMENTKSQAIIYKSTQVYTKFKGTRYHQQIYIKTFSVNSIPLVYKIQNKCSKETELQIQFYMAMKQFKFHNRVALLQPIDIFQIDDNLYLALQQLGPTLQQLIFSGINFSQEQICEIGKRLIYTVSFLHEKGFVHGSIFPDNIIFTKTLNTFYLVDFNRTIQWKNEDQKVIKSYPADPHQNFLRQAYLFGSQNLKENRVPSPRDELQSIFYVLYYLECLNKKKIYKRQQIIKSLLLKDVYNSVKLQKYNEYIPAFEYVKYFHERSRPLNLSQKQQQLSKLQKMLQNINQLYLKHFISQQNQMDG